MKGKALASVLDAREDRMVAPSTQERSGGKADVEVWARGREEPDFGQAETPVPSGRPCKAYLSLGMCLSTVVIPSGQLTKHPPFSFFL